jgi:hypothetical protein
MDRDADVLVLSSKKASDPKSPLWQYNLDPNGIPECSTDDGVRGFQWVTTTGHKIIAVVNHRQKRGQDHHALMNETVFLWRGAVSSNQEAATWFKEDVDANIAEFVAAEDANILLMMQSTVRYTLLRLYLAAGNGGEVENNNAIKAHLHKSHLQTWTKIVGR